MVSKANEDLPDPESPVITTSLFLGRLTSIFFRLWTFAPRILIESMNSIFYDGQRVHYTHALCKITILY